VFLSIPRNSLLSRASIPSHGGSQRFESSSAHHHLRRFSLFQLPFRLPIPCVAGTHEFFQHRTLSLKLVGFEAVGVVSQHVQVRPTQHGSDDLRVLAVRHQPACQRMAEPVETEPLHEVAVDVDLAIINFKDFCPNSGRPQVVLNKDRPEPWRPARSPPGGENVIVSPAYAIVHARP